MSKRSRGPARPAAHRRPGTRPAIDRPSRVRATRASSQLEVAPEIAEDVVEQRPAEAARELEKIARPSYARHRTVKPGSMLAVKAATEYVYVAQDMRRILFVAAALFGVLVVAWLFVVVWRVIPLSFY